MSSEATRGGDAGLLRMLQRAAWRFAGSGEEGLSHRSDVTSEVHS